MDLSDPVVSVLSNGSAWTVTAAVCLTFVRLIYKGKLVPESTVAMKDRTIETQNSVITEQQSTIAEQQAAMMTTLKFFEAIQGERKEASKP